MENPNNKNMKITVNQAAKILGVSGARVRAMLKDKVITGRKIGRDWLVNRASVEARKKKGTKAGRPPKDGK